MLTENDIIQYVCIHLKNIGYKINKALTTLEKGTDIEASHPEKGLCFVEAKGGTSSKKGTNRYEKPFSLNQVKTHIGVAILKAFQIKQNYKDSMVIIALPDDNKQRKVVDSISYCLTKTEIKIYFIKENGNVEEFNSN